MPGLDYSDSVDPREDIVVTALGRRSRTNPDIIKMPKGSFGDATPKVRKIPKSVGFGVRSRTNPDIIKMPKGSFKKGGSVSSASKRADGCCTKGKTKGRMV